MDDEERSTFEADFPPLQFPMFYDWENRMPTLKAFTKEFPTLSWDDAGRPRQYGDTLSSFAVVRVWIRHMRLAKIFETALRELLHILPHAH